MVTKYSSDAKKKKKKKKKKKTSLRMYKSALSWYVVKTFLTASTRGKQTRGVAQLLVSSRAVVIKVVK